MLTVTEFETLKLIHELQVHQIELEMQNEELQRHGGTIRAEGNPEKDAAFYFTLSARAGGESGHEPV